jgi:glycosyltransferase involved in cell wall biosynthesis
MRLPLKILLVSMQAGAPYNQGAERYMNNLAQELELAGHNVVLAAGDPENHYQHVANFAPINQEQNHYKLPTYNWSTVKSVNPKSHMAFLQAIAPDIVHVVHPGHIGLSILTAAQLLNIKIVITVVDFWWTCPKNTLITDDGKQCEGNQNINTCTQ